MGRYTPAIRKKRHHSTSYFATLGRKGGNVTKRRHGTTHYKKVGRMGGIALARRKGARKN